MKREELEKVVGPVLSEIKKGLRNLKSRMPNNYKIQFLELVGGSSRMPFIKTLIRETFGMDPLRTLNLSESVARGAAVYGALQAQLLPLEYVIPNYNLIDVCVSWNLVRHDDYFGENEQQYKERQIIFSANSSAPGQYLMPFDFPGPLEVYIYYGQASSTKSIGYMRFRGPNRVRFLLDASKVVSVELEKGSFSVCRLQDKKETKWADIARWEDELRVVEERIRVIY
jgi:molecular chaperone DnaK (HSP70)